MMLTILENDGDNNYLSERGESSFEIWKHFMTSLDGGGVFMVPEPQKESESIREKLLIRCELEN